MTAHNEDDIIVARIYNDIGAATSAKEKLEEAGIKAIIEDMNVVGMTPLAGIEVKIFSNDLEQAKLILGEEE